jgi:hypothetical protein
MRREEERLKGGDRGMEYVIIIIIIYFLRMNNIFINIGHGTRYDVELKDRVTVLLIQMETEQGDSMNNRQH